MAQRDPARSVESSHRVSPIRTRTLDVLGVKAVGFWADWATRYVPAQAPADSPAGTFAQYMPAITPLPSQPTIALQPDNSTNDAVKPYKTPNTEPDQGPAPGGKANLQQAEKELAWNQVVSRQRSQPWLNTGNQDFHTAEMNFMDDDVVQQMNANPNLFLSQALSKYYAEKRVMDTKAWMNHTTNFEQMEGFATTIKERNKHVVGRFISPGEEQKEATKATYVTQTKGGGPTRPLDLKMGSYYSPPLYISPFG